jgi:non-reducing end alpha-L-arabinofuranosidase
MTKFRSLIPPSSFVLAVSLSACWDYRAADLPPAAGAGGTTSTGGTGGSSTGGTGGAMTPMGSLPCDILGSVSIPCSSAHSTVRRLSSTYNGPLYQLRRPDMTLLDINMVDGYADVAAHDAFCPMGTTCVITMIYDQSPNGNHLTPAPPGSNNSNPGRPAPASRLPVKINGHDAYGILFRPGEGYRAFCYACPYPTSGKPGTALGDEPQTMYMISSQQQLINGCCFDYGNAEWTANNDGEGTMEAVYLGQGVVWGSGVEGGPWAMADLENGLYPGWDSANMSWDNIATATPLKYDFVNAVVVGDTQEKNGGKGRFAVYGGDATAGPLKEMYDGIRPEKVGYVPMAKQGSIILSIGGDNSDGDGGRWYEGVMANGAASKETLDALHAAIVAAGYGK